MKIGSLEIELLAEMARLKTSMDEAKNVVGGAMGSIESAVGNAKAALLGITGTLLGLGSVAAFKGMVEGIIEAKVELQRLSIQTGATVESLSAISVVSKLNGTSIDEVGKAMNKLSKNLASSTEDSKGAAQAIKALGINFDDFVRQNADQKMLTVAKAMAEFNDGSGKAAAAMLLYGKTGAQLLPMLKDLAEQNELIGKQTTESVRQAEEYEKNLKKLQMASAALKREFVEGLLPSMAFVTAEMIRAKKEGEGLFGMLAAGAGAWFKGAPEQQQNKQLFELTDQLLKAEAKLGLSKAERLPMMRLGIAADEAEVASIKKKIAAVQSLRSVTDPDNESSAEAKRLARRKTLDPQLGVKEKPDRLGAQDHFADNIINQLITEYNNLSGSMSKVDEITRKLDGSSKDVTASQRAQALELAGYIDLQKKATDAAKNMATNIVLEITAREKLEAAQDAAFVGLEKLAQEEAFSLSLLNQQPAAINKARFERALFNQELAASATLTARGVQEGWDWTRMLEEQTKMTREAKAARAAFDAQQADAYDKMYNPKRGAADGIKQYLDDIARVGDAMNNATVNAFKGAEDALVKFVTTGKLDFKSFANSIIAEMVRMQIQRDIMGPLGNASKGMDGGFSLSGLFSGVKSLLGFAGGGRPPVGVPSMIGERGPEVFVPDSAGTVVPNSALGRSVTLTTTINIDSRTDRAAVYADVSRAMADNNKRFADQLRQQGVLA